MAIRPQFLAKYALKYDVAMNIPEIQAGFVDRILKEAQEDVDAQFKYVLKLDGDSAFINLLGPMSENGPDWIDLYYGFNGVAYKNLIRASEEILKNDVIKNVFVNSNTPGGNIDGLEAATDSLEFLAQKRPVTAINHGMIASAGVWYTSAAHKRIAANRAAMIGSIGVVIDTLDFTGFYNSFGIEQITITNSDSPNKRPDLLTKEGKAIYIKELNSLFGVFIDRVTDGKSIKKESIKALKGEMIIAADAVKIGLMDSIEGVDTSTAGPAGSTESQKAEIQIKGDLQMDADVKQAFDDMGKNVAALTTQMTALVSTQNSADTKKELSEEDKKFAVNIAIGDAYPKTVKDEAIKTLAGGSDMVTLKAMAGAVDAIKEQNAGTQAAGGEGQDGGNGEETVPNGQMPAGGPKKEANGILETDAEIAAEMKRIKGEM